MKKFVYVVAYLEEDAVADGLWLVYVPQFCAQVY